MLKNIFTVSQISQQIRSCLETQFPSLWIKGELSNFIAHSSGHWYFSLKDEGAQIKGLMFRGENQKLGFKPKNGEEILVYGQISLYPPRGNYQILCKKMEILGSGLLHQRFEQLKNKLKEEGLFDPERKKTLPAFPKHLALITSPTGAAIRDILQVIGRRFKGLKITLIPALVQGEQAPESLLSALSLSKKISSDVLIITRGGGSIEDLFVFNDEALARAIARHPVPVISAIGHEVDFSICDFVADLRAPTPSAAAELVTQSATELKDKIRLLKKQMTQNLLRQLYFLKDKLLSLEKSFSQPDRLIQDFSQKLDELSLKFHHSLKQNFLKKAQKLDHLEELFNSLNPKKVMQRGFSIISTSKGVIKDTKELNLKEKLCIDFFKGQAKAQLIEKE